MDTRSTLRAQTPATPSLGNVKQSSHSGNNLCYQLFLVTLTSWYLLVATLPYHTVTTYSTYSSVFSRPVCVFRGAAIPQYERPGHRWYHPYTCHHIAIRGETISTFKIRKCLDTVLFLWHILNWISWPGDHFPTDTYTITRYLIRMEWDPMRCEHMQCECAHRIASHVSAFDTRHACICTRYSLVFGGSVMHAYACICIRCERMRCIVPILCIRIACARTRIACAHMRCECAHLRGTYACPVLYKLMCDV